MKQQKLKLAIACAIVAALLGGASNAWADCSSDVSKVLQGAAFIRDGYELLAKVERNEDSEDVERDLSTVDDLANELRKIDRIGLRSLTAEEKEDRDSETESIEAGTKSAELTNQTDHSTDDEDDGSTLITPTTAGNAHDAGLLTNSPLPPSSSLDEIQEADVAIIGGDADDELTGELQQFDSRLLHLNADATEALQESGNLVTEPSSIASIDQAPILSAEPPATPEEENMQELNEPIQSGPTNNTMPNEPHDGFFFDESAEDDVARTLREAIQMESDPNIKAELKRSYDDYMKILKK